MRILSARAKCVRLGNADEVKRSRVDCAISTLRESECRRRDQRSRGCGSTDVLSPYVVVRSITRLWARSKENAQTSAVILRRLRIGASHKNNMLRAVVFIDGRAEAAFRDGSGLILSKHGAVTTFKPNGERRRCLAKTAVKELKPKVLELISRVNGFLPAPIVTPDLCECSAEDQHYTKRSNARWRASDLTVTEEGAELASVDGDCKVFIRPHQRFFFSLWSYFCRRIYLKSDVLESDEPRRKCTSDKEITLGKGWWS